jgi:hypothetical protein
MGEFVFKEEYDWFVAILNEAPVYRTASDIERLLGLVNHNSFFGDLPRSISLVLCKYMSFERFPADGKSECVSPPPAVGLFSYSQHVKDAKLMLPPSHTVPQPLYSSKECQATSFT